MQPAPAGQPCFCTVHLLTKPCCWIAADDACVVSQLKALVVTSGGPWALVPAAGGPGPSWDSWAAGFAELGVRLLGGGACSRRCSKTMLHRHAAAPDVPAFIEQVNSQVQVCAGGGAHEVD